MQSRHGLTIIEISVVMVLLAVVMLAVSQSLVATRDFVDQDAVAGDLSIEGQRLIDELVNDLGNSAWYFPSDLDNANGQRPPYGSDSAEAALLQSTTASVDRAIRYYPYVIVQSPTGVNTGQLAGWTRSSGEVLDPAALPAELPGEHRDISQEVVFLRARTGATTATPQEQTFARIDFGADPLPMSTYNASRDGVAVNALALSTTAALTLLTDTVVAWESDVADPTATQLIAGDYMREYSYVVVPEANTGKGRLERRYRNGVAGTVSVDRVLSTNVDRLVIDTYRTRAGLAVNQVRISLYLSRELPGRAGEFQTHRVQLTTALRNVADSNHGSGLATGISGGARSVQ